MLPGYCHHSPDLPTAAAACIACMLCRSASLLAMPPSTWSRCSIPPQHQQQQHMQRSTSMTHACQTSTHHTTASPRSPTQHPRQAGLLAAPHAAMWKEILVWQARSLISTGRHMSHTMTPVPASRTWAAMVLGVATTGQQQQHTEQ